MPRDRREIDRQFLALHKAYLEGIKRALGDPPGFPNCIQPFDLGMGDDPLGYAIYWSPLPFVERLLDLGSDPNYSDPCGFPSLLAIVSAQDKSDRHERLHLLLAYGASVEQRGINDWTALHHAVALRDVEAMRILLAHGADPAARTRTTRGGHRKLERPFVRDENKIFGLRLCDQNPIEWIPQWTRQ